MEAREKRQGSIVPIKGPEKGTSEPDTERRVRDGPGRPYERVKPPARGVLPTPEVEIMSFTVRSRSEQEGACGCLAECRSLEFRLEGV